MQKRKLMRKQAIIFGYARISTMKQRIERQIDNIKQAYPDAVIISEAYTGATIDRPAFTKLLQQIQPGDTLVFDEVSRMSRNADDGFRLYKELYEKGVTLVFIKEPHINSDVYRDRTQKRIETLTASTGSAATDKFIQTMIDALNAYSMDIVQEQIQIAFQQAQAEVDHLRRRTSEGVRKAQAEGKQIGRAAGIIIETQKAKRCKEIILRRSASFNGELSDAETMLLCGCSRNSYYKYKRELAAEK